MSNDEGVTVRVLTIAWVKPEEIAELVAYLLSPASSATSGAKIPVYGRADL